MILAKYSFNRKTGFSFYRFKQKGFADNEPLFQFLQAEGFIWG